MPTSFRLPFLRLLPLLLASPLSIAALLPIALVLPMAHAQTHATIESAATDPDFAVQGEYVAGNRAMQVIALGDGEFQIVIYEGGLPGAGWDRQPPRQLDGDEEVVAQLVESMGLARTERQSPTLGTVPPPGAIVLFDGTPQSLQEHWSDGARMTADGLLIQGATTRQSFADYRLHLEFRTPFMPAARGQGRGNSGVYHQGRYETQILDSFGLAGKDNESGGIYSVSSPELNACLPPLAWQTYDVDFTAARFDEAGQKLAPARLTVRLNGIVVQNDVAVPGPTTAAPISESPLPGPIYLQDHGNPVHFRNVWLIPRDLEQEARRPIVPAFERFFAATGSSDPRGERLLVNALGCAACHAISDQPANPTDAVGPDLSEVAGRVRAEHLVDFIASPHDIKPGTTMPDPWAGYEPAERRQAAEAITQFLLAVGPPLVDEVGEESAAERGESLFHTIGCVACHAPRLDPSGQPLAEMSPGADDSVPLGDLAAKYTLDSLTRFLQDPVAVRPHGRMPRLAADATESRDLATYLLRDVVVVPPRETLRRRVYHGKWDRLPDFETLTPVSEDRVGKLDVHAADLKGTFGVVYDGYIELPRSGSYTFRLVSDDGARLILDGETIVDHDGVHPATERSRRVRRQAGVFPLRIEYFEAGGQRDLAVRVEVPELGTVPITSLVSTEPTGRQPFELAETKFRRDPSQVDAGRSLFVSVGCNRCHSMQAELTAGAIAGERDWDALRWDVLRPERGCLASDVPRGAVNYDLTDHQRRTLHATIGRGQGESLVSHDLFIDRLDDRLLSLQCYACHVRDGIGGPEGKRRDHFLTTTPEMGDEGRLAPLLTGVGDKLNDEYLHRVLAEGANLRPYMKTRMPGFGAVPTAALAGWLIEADRTGIETSGPSPTTTNATERDAGLALAHQQLADGRLLAGNDGLACIKCHTFGGVGLAGIQAIDVLQMPTRLREEWFHRYLLDPQAYRPGTRMPASFPDGRSVVTSIADGEPAPQSVAMWAYFSQGAEAKPPSGLFPDAIELRADDRPLIYRNFISGLSPRGIAVAYPAGIHVAWDAQRMTLARVWKNAFIDAGKHWIGRGPGFQEPLGDAVLTIDTATPIARTIDPDAAWPESPTADPPRFLGYRLDEAGLPTFRYRIGDLEVEDTPQPLASASGQASLVRTWKINGTGPVALLAAVGRVIPDPSPGLTADDAATMFLVNDVYRLQMSESDLRIVRFGDRDELRVMVDLGQTPSSVTITQRIDW
ncbi:MAG: DUF1080 domain-containing protein [Planctomycetaceae bacterium]|nr:MAG: DUF1080 domain-containing protein [Planctomycetaceae bacterium]